MNLPLLAFGEAEVSDTGGSDPVAISRLQLEPSQEIFDRLLECAPSGGQAQAAVLTGCWA